MQDCPTLKKIKKIEVVDQSVHTYGHIYAAGAFVNYSPASGDFGKHRVL
jgi:hypothetical protein